MISVRQPTPKRDGQSVRLIAVLENSLCLGYVACQCARALNKPKDDVPLSVDYSVRRRTENSFSVFAVVPAIHEIFRRTLVDKVAHGCYSPAFGLSDNQNATGNNSNRIRSSRHYKSAARGRGITARSRIETFASYFGSSALRVSARSHSFAFAVIPSPAEKPAELGVSPALKSSAGTFSACVVLPSAVLPAVGNAVVSSLSGVLEQERPDTLSSTGAASHATPAAPVSVLRICSHAITFAATAESRIQSSLKGITAFIEGFVMRSTYEEKIAVASENARRIRQGTDVFVRPIFADVAKLLWPHKTAAQLASIAKRDERTAARWLSGEFEPPISIVLAVNQKIFGKGA